MNKTQEALKLALKRAFNLGQTYWQQADSEYTSQWKKADVTLASFNQLVEDTIRKALAEQCVCGEPNTPGTHRTDGPCLAERPTQQWCSCEPTECKGVGRCRWQAMNYSPLDKPAQPNWNLVYLHSAMEYIREHHPQVYEECGDTDEFRADRLKELEQPAPVAEPHKQQEPDYSICPTCGGMASDPIVPPEYRKQEPVAYRHLHEDGWEYYDAPTGDDCEGCQPLYTRPQPAAQWVGLTDEHRREVINAAWNGYLRGEGSDSFSWHLTQVIEAKLREKNHG